MPVMGLDTWPHRLHGGSVIWRRRTHVSASLADGAPCLRVWVSLSFDFLVRTDAYRTRSAPQFRLGGVTIGLADASRC
jgi:hypothetical protein